MIITSGRFKGRKLKTPQGLTTRPTQSRLRAAIFNSLQHEIEGVSFLDVCAGSGAVGFEALSRGAEKITFIENDKRAIQAIIENIKMLSIDGCTHLLTMDACSAIKKLIKDKKSYGIVYFDPPYATKLTQEVIQLIDANAALIAPGGYLVVEEKSGVIFKDYTIESFELEKEKVFGETTVSLFARSD